MLGGDLFDLSNVDLDFEFKAIDKPIRTKAGKLGLRVSKFESLKV